VIQGCLVWVQGWVWWESSEGLWRHETNSKPVPSSGNPASPPSPPPHSISSCQGRSNPGKWIDYSLYGHQLVVHFVGEDYDGEARDRRNPVDGDEVPVMHFGVCLPVDEFHALAARLKAAEIKFVIEPHLRFEGRPGEQWTMFFRDPSGNALEFKALTNPANLFARYHEK
jgi:uncharacterized protein